MINLWIIITSSNEDAEVLCQVGKNESGNKLTKSGKKDSGYIFFFLKYCFHWRYIIIIIIIIIGLDYSCWCNVAESDKQFVLSSEDSVTEYDFHFF